MKTREQYEREMIALDQELFDLAMKMEDLKNDFIFNYGIYEWEELYYKVHNGC